MAKIRDALTRRDAMWEGVDCPACGEGNLHHGEVTVFNRGEDDPKCLVTKVGLFGTSIKITDGKGNPSSRRDGVLIEFTCEHCYAGPVLEIIQHKGATFIQWREL